jgi:RHS repeat-associated protein
MTLDSNHNMVATVVPTPWSVTTAGAWTYEAGSYQVPANVAYVYFYANVYQSSGTTTARFDDGFAIFGTHYFHPDQLSTRLTTDATGAVIGQQGHFPFGESWYAQNTTTNWQFTSYQRDAESGNDYAMARSYVNRLARFSSPDPADFTAANPINPQSWNRYAYVLDNPLGNVDPLGLDPCAGSNLTWISNFANGTGIFDSQDCAANGGTWDNSGAGPADTTVYVTADPVNSGEYGNPPNQSVGGLLSNSSGGGFFSTLKAKVCSLIPSGRTSGVSVGVGGVGSVGGGVEFVMNYNSGQVSAFAFGGVQAGWNGGASGSVYSGPVYGLNDSNSNYSGGFTGINGGAGIGIFAASTSGGLTGGAKTLGVHTSAKGATTAFGLSLGGGLLSGFSGGVSATNYTNPAQIGRFAGFTPVDYTLYGARQICK